MQLMAVRGWRIVSASSGPGMLMWFDPNHEQPLLRALTLEEKRGNLQEEDGVSLRERRMAGAGAEAVHGQQLDLLSGGPSTTGGG